MKGVSSSMVVSCSTAACTLGDISSYRAQDCDFFAVDPLASNIRSETYTWPYRDLSGVIEISDYWPAR